MEKQDALRAAGVNEVIIMAVNDGAVMQAWAKSQKTGLSVSQRFCLMVLLFWTLFLISSIFVGVDVVVYGGPQQQAD